MAFVLVVLGLVLTGCSGGIDQPANADNTTTKVVKKKPVAGYPAVGIKRGVERSGRSTDKFGAFDNWGLSYACKEGLKSIKVNDFGTINYNGVVISHDEDSFYAGKKKNRTRYVTSFTLDFDGRTDWFADKGVSLIVVTPEDVFKHFFVGSDDKVINLTPGMIKSGLTVDATDLNLANAGYIGKLTICARP